ncbi:methyl-accepting chemotaxis protein [Acidovorax sp. BL-A-41-H1]|uniref:methyl-accepting chemotaxis protein n=1 Tax=Acidovorax sp. BL-A-41-H1 TaxID=3421102 RepID=UPI003F7AF3D9
MQRSSLSTAQRLMLGFGLVITLLVLCIAFSYRALTVSNESMQTIYEDRTVALGQLSDIRYLIARNRIIMMDAQESRDAALVQRRMAEYDTNTQRATEIWKAYSATFLTPDEKQLVKQMEDEWATYRDKAEKPTAEALRSQKFEDSATGFKAISKLSPPVQKTLDALIQLQVKVANDTYTDASSVNATTLTTLLGLGLFAVVAPVAAALVIVRKIVGVLGAEPHELAFEATRIAEGDLTHQNGRIIATGSVMANMDTMRNRLNQVVNMVRESAEAVAASSGQIAQGTQDLSARTEEQASSLEQTAASMEQMAATVGKNSEGADGAHQMTTRASAIAHEGGEAMARMVETMKDIQTSSQKIADIIGVIDSIAFQTNILALNAAVEAARAGEQGRGFAVVATEVRALASRSADAAREIKTLIHTSAERVNQGSTLAMAAGETINKVVTSIRDVATVMSEIRHSASEQTAGIGQVSDAMGQIDQTTQQNAALVEEMAAASSHLKQQSDTLVNAVASFKLEHVVPGTPAPGRRPAQARLAAA